MKRLWLYFVKIYLNVGLFFYYKRIKVSGIEHIPKNAPTLIICNHQNALIDPLLIATRIPQYAYYLTRAGVFTSAFIHKFLNSLNMIPVYRIRDGWSNLTLNNPIFDKVCKLLSNAQTIVIFPEGSHNLVRRVRPLNKGFTRIIIDTLEAQPELELKLVPIGLNFVKAEAFPDSVAMNIGEPILVKIKDYQHKSDWVADLKAQAISAMKTLTTHIPKDQYDEIIQKIETLNLDYMDAETINNCIANNFSNCKKRPNSQLNFLRRALKFLLIINLFIPYLIWKFLIEPKIDEIEFRSTFRFGVAVVVVPIYLVLTVSILSGMIGYSWAISYALFIIGLELLTVKL